MKRNSYTMQLLLIGGILSISLFITMSCSGLFSDPEDAPTDVFWVQVKTGIAGSSYYGDFSDFTDTKHAQTLDSGGLWTIRREVIGSNKNIQNNKGFV